MSVNAVQARDEVFTLFLAQWIEQTPPVLGYTPSAVFQGVESGGPPAGQLWARVGMTTATDFQAAFSSCVQGPGQRLYDVAGLVTVQIFIPMAVTNAFNKAHQVAMLVKNMFRRKETPGGVWFRNCRIVEIEPDAENYRFNVIAEYEHGDIY